MTPSKKTIISLWFENFLMIFRLFEGKDSKRNIISYISYKKLQRFFHQPSTMLQSHFNVLLI